MSARCPICGFAYAWDGSACNHCPTPGRRRELWDTARGLRGFRPYPPGFRTARSALTNLAAACLGRVADLITNPAVREFVTGWDAGPGGSRLPELARQAAAALPAAGRPWSYSTDPGELITAAAAGFARLIVQPESDITAVELVADHASRAAAYTTAPERGLGDFPLPPDLEPYRATVLREVRERVEGTRTRIRARPADDPVFRAFTELDRAARQYNHRRAIFELAEAAAQAALFRDLVAYPFEPVVFDPGWRTSTVVALARGMYESRDFGPMPVLADALQDAGCEDPAVLDHCRDPEQVHVRGCWVFEAVLTAT
jgi:hypothetical protein